jgi:hypothetical protein
MRLARTTPASVTTLLSFWAAVAGLPLTPCFAQTDAETSASAATALQAQATFSPGIRDVLKMVDAKVDAEVIKTYIKNSSTAYNPNASEIIALKEHGVPDELITGLIERGGEIRTQFAHAASQAAPPAPEPATAPNTPQPQYGYGNDYGASMAFPAPSYPSYADYAYGYPYAGYPYYPYYGYPCGYWYSWYYPWAFYYPFSFAFFCHQHDGHFHDGHFHDGHSVAVHGHNGSSGHSAPWAPASRGSVAQGSFAGHTGFAARPTMTSSSAARVGGVAVRPSAFNGARNMGFAPRSAGFAPRSAGFAPRSAGFAPRSAGFAPRSASFAPRSASFAPRSASFAPRSAGFAPRSGGMAMRSGGGGFAMRSGGGGGHGSGGFGGGHGGGHR